MIKLIIWDLDGVLLESRDLHYYALNAALEDIDEDYVITTDEHLSTYDGLPTTKKLEMLTKQKGLLEKYYSAVWSSKQEKTRKLIDEMKPDLRIVDMVKKFFEQGYVQAVDK